MRRFLGSPQWWGVADQGFSSITNLGLSVVAARQLHTSGLGVVYVGFAAYLFALAAQRAFVTDPLTVHAAPLEQDEAWVAVNRGFVAALIGAMLMTGVVVAIGFAAGGRFGLGILLFTPWVAGALLQDFWRAALFRAGRGPAAALNDGVWAIVMGGAVVLALRHPSEWTIVAAWGSGAAAGAFLGWFQLRMWRGVPSWSVRRTWDWWRQEIFPLGRWLGLESMCIAATGLVVPFIVVAVLSPAALGGLRAVDTVFAPMTLLAQGLELPWLPQLARDWGRSTHLALRGAIRASTLALALLLPYLALMVAFREDVLGLIFGPGFRPFAPLVIPVAVSEMAFGCSVGPMVLLKAARRGRARLVGRVVGSIGVVGLVTALAATRGLTWSVWGRTLGMMAGESVAVWLAISGALRTPPLWRSVPGSAAQQAPARSTDGATGSVRAPGWTRPTWKAVRSPSAVPAGAGEQDEGTG